MQFRVHDIESQLFLLIAISIFSVLWIRVILWGVLDDNLKGNERKRREKGQTLLDRFLFRRYYDVFPKILLYLFMAVLIIHPLSIFIVILAVVCEWMREFSSFVVNAVMYFDFIWFFVVELLSLIPGRKKNDYSGWIRKLNKK